MHAQDHGHGGAGQRREDLRDEVALGLYTLARARSVAEIDSVTCALNFGDSGSRERRGIYTQVL